MNRVLADTNILIYALDESSHFHEQSANFLLSENTILYTTTKNISEYFAVCSKIGVSKLDTIAFYDEIKENITILFPNEKSLDLFEDLIDKYNPRGNRVFDIEIVSIMLAYDIKQIQNS